MSAEKINDTQEDFDEQKFKLWIEYEKIAMHFNGLIIQLRGRALAGIGIITTFTALFLETGNNVLETGTNTGANWEFLSVLSILLMLAWGAIFIIDYFYYNKLLSGAVKAIVKLEESTKSQKVPILMSREIEKSAGNSKGVMKWFYGTVFVLLVLLFFYSLHKNEFHFICGCFE